MAGNLAQNIQRRVTASPNGHFTVFLSAMVNMQARERIQALEEWAVQRDREIAELSSTVSWLKATVEAIRVSGPPRQPSCARTPSSTAPNPRPPVPPPSPLAAAPDPPPVSPRPPPQSCIPNLRLVPFPDPPVPPPRRAPPPAPSAVAQPAAPPGFASRIVADFPALFAEFRGKRFTLLWRGSRDGFSARDFHRHCDGHAPTLTLIQDTEGSIFGGFTPVEWESRVWNGNGGLEDNCQKADPSRNSFLFTLENPHNLSARKFTLKTEAKGRAIVCDASWGPDFGDISISDRCNANDRSESCPDQRYVNDTGLDGKTVLTGSQFFTVKEIEVFEITG
jgi:hypothetical protein